MQHLVSQKGGIYLSEQPARAVVYLTVGGLKSTLAGWNSTPQEHGLAVRVAEETLYGNGQPQPQTSSFVVPDWAFAPVQWVVQGIERSTCREIEPLNQTVVIWNCWSASTEDARPALGIMGYHSAQESGVMVFQRRSEPVQRLIALGLREEDHQRCVDALGAADVPDIGAPPWLFPDIIARVLLRRHRARAMSR